MGSAGRRQAPECPFRPPPPSHVPTVSLLLSPPPAPPTPPGPELVLARRTAGPAAYHISYNRANDRGSPVAHLSPDAAAAAASPSPPSPLPCSAVLRPAMAMRRPPRDDYSAAPTSHRIVRPPAALAARPVLPCLPAATIGPSPPLPPASSKSARRHRARHVLPSPPSSPRSLPRKGIKGCSSPVEPSSTPSSFPITHLPLSESPPTQRYPILAHPYPHTYPYTLTLTRSHPPTPTHIPA